MQVNSIKNMWLIIGLITLIGVFSIIAPLTFYFFDYDEDLRNSYIGCCSATDQEYINSTCGFRVRDKYLCDDYDAFEHALHYQRYFSRPLVVLGIFYISGLFWYINLVQKSKNDTVYDESRRINYCFCKPKVIIVLTSINLLLIIGCLVYAIVEYNNIGYHDYAIGGAICITICSIGLSIWGLCVSRMKSQGIITRRIYLNLVSTYFPVVLLALLSVFIRPTNMDFSKTYEECCLKSSSSNKV